MAGKRPDGEGTIRKRVDGRWEGIIVVGHKEDGSPIFKSVFAKTKKELVPKLHAIIEEYRGVELTEECRMTLNEWMEKWMKEYAEPTLRYNTVKGYRTIIENHVAPVLGEKPIRKVTTADVQKLYNSKKTGDKPLADSYVRRMHMLLHEIMESAVAAHLIPKNPTAGTTVPKCNYAPKRILNDEQLDRYMEAIRKEPLWYDFFYTEITTGMRKGEICGLQWKDLDLETGRLNVQRTVCARGNGELAVGETKTETGKRSIQLPPSTLHLLKERKKTAITEWIFPSLLMPEKPTSPSAAYHRHKEILKQAGLPDISFHDLRHTFATHALTSGVDPKTLSKILGHTNASFTLDTYTHVTTDMHKNAAGIVGGFMEEIFGKELKPWEKQNEIPATEPSD